MFINIFLTNIQSATKEDFGSYPFFLSPFFLCVCVFVVVVLHWPFLRLQLLLVSQVVPAWLNCLPIKSDLIEAKVVHEQLCSMVER